MYAMAVLPCPAGSYLEVLACRLIVHDVCLASAVHGVGDLLTSTALVQADLRHTWQQAQGGAHADQTAGTGRQYSWV